MTRVITVFGSSRPREGDPEYAEALELGSLLARAGFDVCNGGFAGIMEATARGARDAGGHTIGVTVGNFGKKANAWIEREISSKDIAERIHTLMSLGDGYVVLKGGTGTLLELATVWEFINKGIAPEKPVVMLGPFWKDVVGTLRRELSWEGIGDCTRFILEASSPTECVRMLAERIRPAE